MPIISSKQNTLHISDHSLLRLYLYIAANVSAGCPSACRLTVIDVQPALPIDVFLHISYALSRLDELAQMGIALEGSRHPQAVRARFAYNDLYLTEKATLYRYLSSHETDLPGASQWVQAGTSLALTCTFMTARMRTVPEARLASLKTELRSCHIDEPQIERLFDRLRQINLRKKIACRMILLEVHRWLDEMAAEALEHSAASS